jgi:hypothetical protein
LETCLLLEEEKGVQIMMRYMIMMRMNMIFLRHDLPRQKERGKHLKF